MHKYKCTDINLFHTFREFYDVQPRLQPIHWRLLEDGRHRPTTRDIGINQSVESSIYLSSAVIRQLESNPLPSTSRNASGYSQLHFIPSSSSSGSKRRVKREDFSAALSKNITMILEDLLRGYDKTERPSYKQGTYVYTIAGTIQLHRYVFSMSSKFPQFQEFA